jgi:ELWxxDGT repeat protein
LVKDINPGPASGLRSNILNAGIRGGFMHFGADDGVHGLELWRTTGTGPGTQLEVDINPGPADSGPALFTLSNNILFFVASNGVQGQELWRLPGLQPPITAGPTGGDEPSAPVAVPDGPTAFFLFFDPVIQGGTHGAAPINGAGDLGTWVGLDQHLVRRLMRTWLDDSWEMFMTLTARASIS